MRVNERVLMCLRRVSFRVALADRTNTPPAMATIFATRVAVSVRPTVRASSEDKVCRCPLLPSPVRHPSESIFSCYPKPATLCVRSRG